MSKIANYVISLANAKERRAHIEQEFGKHNISFEFFDALSLDSGLDNVITQYLPHLHQAALTNGEKGCFMSHFMLWKKCVDDNLDYIAIFEDDIFLSKDSPLFLLDDSWLKERFHSNQSFILRLETFLMPVLRERSLISNYQERSIETMNSHHFGTAGYIISKDCAKYLIALFQDNYDSYHAIDEIIFNQLLEDKNFIVYQLCPAICVQELQFNKENSSLFSQIEKDRKSLRTFLKPKKTLLQRIKRMYENIYRALTKYQRIKEKKRLEKLIVPFL